MKEMNKNEKKDWGERGDKLVQTVRCRKISIKRMGDIFCRHEELGRGEDMHQIQERKQKYA